MTLEAFLHDQLGLDDRWQVTSVVADDASVEVGQASSPLPWWASLPHWSGAELACKRTERVSAARLWRGGENPEPAIRIRVQETPDFWRQEICPQCQGRSVVVVGHQTAQEWRHLDLLGRRTILNAALPQGQCRQCKGITAVRPPWQGRSVHFTRQFEDHVRGLIRAMSLYSVGELVCEPSERLWDLFHAYMDQPAGLAADQTRCRTPSVRSEANPNDTDSFHPERAGC